MRNLIAFILFLAATTTNASTISHYGYSLNPASNIVTSADGSLEWLQWTQTQNMRAADVTAFAAGTEWQLASSAQITDLYEDFFPFSGTWDAEVNFYINNANLPMNELQQRAHNFGDLFGITYSPVPSVRNANALYRLNNGNVARAAVFGCPTLQCTPRAWTRANTYQNVPNGISYMGWALVRPAAVPLPAAGWLFVSALGLLIGKRKMS
jgi:hypothetical protein